MSIENFNKCPHCGGTLGYYQKVRYKGCYHDNTLFDTREPENTEMFDECEETFRSKGYYCMECNRFLTY